MVVSGGGGRGRDGALGARSVPVQQGGRGVKFLADRWGAAGAAPAGRAGQGGVYPLSRRRTGRGNGLPRPQEAPEGAGRRASGGTTAQG